MDERFINKRISEKTVFFVCLFGGEYIEHIYLESILFYPVKCPMITDYETVQHRLHL